jgi:hypothetical protein
MEARPLLAGRLGLPRFGRPRPVRTWIARAWVARAWLAHAGLAAAACLGVCASLAASAYPQDVQRHADRSEACQHFSGEEPYDAERRAFLLRRIQQTCTGLEAQRKQLQRKYRGRKAILEKLAALDRTD